MDTAENTLVIQALDGDEQAFGQLYDRYARLIRAICYETTGRLDEAQDLAQEVFLRAYEKLGRLKDPQRFGGWLVSIARNVCKEYRRKKARDRHMLVGLEPPEAISQPDDLPEQLEHLRAAMGQLDQQERLALNVFYLQDKDIEQTKKILGVSRSGLYRLLDRAKKKLAKFINDG